MATITTKNGTQIYYKDWGKGQPIVFSHGWPLSADDWDTQMLFFLKHGYRVIAHDRRGQWPAVAKHDGLTFAPVLVVDLRPIFCRNCRHVIFSFF